MTIKNSSNRSRFYLLWYIQRERKKTASAFGSCSPELAVVLSAFGHRETEKERSPSQKKKLQSNVTVQYISVPALTHNSQTAFLILWQISISFLQGSHKFRWNSKLINIEVHIEKPADFSCGHKGVFVDIKAVNFVEKQWEV